MLASLSRCLSFEQDEGLCLVQRPADEPRLAASAPLPPPSLPPQPPLPPSEAVPEAAVPRSAVVAELEAYLARLGALGALADGPGISSSPPDLPPSAEEQDPQLADALRKVRQLDGALSAAASKAAAVAAQGRELELRVAQQQQQEQAGAADGTGGDDVAGATEAGQEGSLVTAMRREHRRAQHAARLLAALQEGAPSAGCPTAGTAADPAQLPELTATQEQLLQALLSQPAEAPGSAAPPNPYDASVAELAAIDARLAQLQAGGAGREGGLGEADGAVSPAAAAALQEAAECCTAAGEGLEEEVALARASFERWAGPAAFA